VTTPTNLLSAPPTDEIADLSPVWLSQALQHIGAGAVTAVLPTRVGTGQMGTSWQLELTWAEPELAHAAGAPTSLVAKMAGGDPATRTLISDGYRNEFVWYTGVSITTTIETPHCWYATITEDNTVFVLLLDDLSPALPGVQAQGVTIEQAHISARNLAGLHGPRWRDDSLLSVPALSLATPEGAQFHEQIFAGAVPTFIERFRPWISDDDIAVMNDLTLWIGEWLVAGQDRFTLIHGDYRPDNLMFFPDGTTVSTLDWQTLGLGFGGRDLGYFLATSLDSDERRTHERDIVTTYYEALKEHSVVDFSFDQCFVDYRLGMVQGPLITILGAVYATAVPSDESNAMFSAMITRSCAAIREHNPQSLL